MTLPSGIVAGVSAQRGEAVGRKRGEAGHGHAPGHVGDVGVQPPVLVHDDHAAAPAPARGPDEIALDLAVALGRGIRDGLALDARVVLVYLLRQRVVRREHIEQGGGGEAAYGELGRLVEKLPALDDAVHVLIEQIQQFLVEITRLSALHDGLLVLRNGMKKRSAPGGRCGGGIIHRFEAMRP